LPVADAYSHEARKALTSIVAFGAGDTANAIEREIDEAVLTIATLRVEAEAPDHPHAAVAVDFHARIVAAGETATFQDLNDWMSALELRWGASSPAPIDQQTVERIAEALESMAGDDSIADADYEAALKRIDDLADRLNEGA
jgi:hypothetical protein